MRKLILVLLIIPGFIKAQNYRTDQAGGAWTTNTSWEVFSGGTWVKLESTLLPTPSSTSGTILIQHNITVGANVTADQVTIASGITLTISATRILTISDGTGVDLVNNGTITTTGTLSFAANSTYQHARDGGTIPLATWGSNSTCYVTGIVNTNPTLIASNAYQNFVWECSQAGTRSLAGNLRTVNGNLLINETGDQELRFSAGTAYNLTIGGDFTVSGTSAIAFGTGANPVNITLTGDFDFSSTATLESQFKTTGLYNFSIAGAFSQSSGTINMSTGANTGTINVAGDFLQTGGTITRTGGTGSIVLNGTVGAQNLTVKGTLSSIVDLTVSNTSGVSLAGNLALPSNFTQNSGAGVFDLNGFLLSIDGTVTQTSGTIGVNTTAELVLQGSGTLSGSLEFTGTDMFRLELNQSGTINSTSAVTITNLNLFNGTLTSNTLSMAVGGLINRSLGSITNTPLGTSYNVQYSNSSNISSGAELPSSPSVLIDLTKQGSGTTTLNQALVTINGDFNLTTGTFAAGGNSITLIGNFNSNATLTSSAGSVFTFAGANSTLSGGTAPTFNGLTINGIFTPSVNYRVNGNLIVGVSGVVNPGSITVTFGGTTVVTNNGTLNLNAVTVTGGNSLTAPSTTMGIAGNFTTPGTFNNGTGTILFNGTTNLSAVETYRNVIVSGVVTSTGNFGQTIGGDLTVNGSFSLGTTGNITWSGSGTISGTGSITVSDITVSGTSCTYIGSGTLTLNDDLLGTGSFNSSGATGTVVIAGATAQIAGSGAKTFGDLTITGSLTPATTYTVVGNLKVDGVLISGSTVIFGGTTQNVSGTGTKIAFNTITIKPSSNLTINPNVTINANLTVDGTVSCLSNVTFVGLTMGGAGTATFNGFTVGTGTLSINMSYSIAGDLAISGSLRANSGNTTFNGNTTISGSGAATFSSVIISGTLTNRTSAQPAITITGSITNNGTFNGSSGTISLGGNLVNNGTFNGNTGTINFNTTNSSVTRTITGSNSISFFNVGIFDKGVAADVTNQLVPPLTLDILGTLSFGEANSVIDADGSGNSILRFVSSSDNLSTDGRVGAITQTGSSISGIINVQRYVSSENRIYRYISSPVVGATVAQLKASIPVTGVLSDPSNSLSSPPCIGCATTSPSLFSFNEGAAQSYSAFPASGVSSSSATFVNGRGYSAFFRHSGLGAVGTVVLNFMGTNPPSTAISLPVSAVANGYSLVGNPYPSPIVWNNGTGWSKTNIQDGIVVRDNATGIHQVHGTADNFIIAPGQSFWVNTSAAGSGALSINENAKTTGAYSFYRVAESILDKVEIQLTKATTGATDIAQISIIPQNSLSSFDQYDVIKYNNSVSTINDDGTTTITEVQDVSTLSSDLKVLGLNSIPSITCGQEFNIKVTNFVNTGEATVNYSIQVKPSGSLEAISWSLFDQYTNQTIDLSQNPIYNFSVTNSIAASKASDRFKLIATSAAAIDQSASITSASSVCDGTEPVLVLSSQKGMAYSVEVNGLLYPNVAIGTGDPISVFIENDWLNSATNSIRVKANSGCDQKFLNQVVEVTKQVPPTAPLVSSANLCKPGATNLIATGNGVDFKWYESEAGSTVIASGAEFTTPLLSDSTTYFVAAVGSTGCESERAIATVSMVDLAKAISIDNVDPVCVSESITLSATSNLDGGSFEWFEQGGSLPIATGNQLQISSLIDSKVFEVIYNDVTGCKSSRLAVTANVIKYFPTIQTKTEKDFVCAGQSHTLSASGAEESSVYKWYDSSESLIPIFEGPTFTSSPLTHTTDYYVSSLNMQGCPSTRQKVSAKIDEANSNVSVQFTATKICREGETNIAINSGVADAINYNWYDAPDGKYPLFQGTSIATPTLKQSTSYYLSYLTANGCESKARKELLVNVTSYPEPLIDSSKPGLLKSNFQNGNQWYLNNEPLAGETNQELVIKESGDYDLMIAFDGCEERTGAINVTTIVTGIEDAMREISIYPNPVSELLTIRVTGTQEAVVCEFIDQKGSTIRSLPLFQTVHGAEGQIDVKPYSAGIYFLKISSGDKSTTHRVILK